MCGGEWHPTTRVVPAKVDEGEVDSQLLEVGGDVQATRRSRARRPILWGGRVIGRERSGRRPARASRQRRPDPCGPGMDRRKTGLSRRKAGGYWPPAACP